VVRSGPRRPPVCERRTDRLTGAGPSVWAGQVGC
jgi:hypothetical protein